MIAQLRGGGGGAGGGVGGGGGDGGGGGGNGRGGRNSASSPASSSAANLPRELAALVVRLYVLSAAPLALAAFAAARYAGVKLVGG